MQPALKKYKCIVNVKCKNFKNVYVTADRCKSYKSFNYKSDDADDLNSRSSSYKVFRSTTSQRCQNKKRLRTQYIFYDVGDWKAQQT